MLVSITDIKYKAVLSMAAYVRDKREKTPNILPSTSSVLALYNEWISHSGIILTTEDTLWALDTLKDLCAQPFHTLACACKLDKV